MLLAGDVGATKTELAIFVPDRGSRAPLVQQRFHSADYAGLEAIARELLGQVRGQAGITVTDACFDVPGPVVDGRARLTNLPWLLDERELATALGLESVHLLNDLFAVATAVPLLTPDDLHTLNVGTPRADGVVAVIAPGTGLGEAFLTREGTESRAHPSEGGHSDFAPNTELEVELPRYLRERLGHVSVERVCSGLGIPNIYDFLCDRGYGTESSELAARLATAGDRTPLIIDAALSPNARDGLCAAALDLFVSILGAEASNLALKTLATGGVYLGGGILPRILPLLDDGRFIAAFQAKGRFASFLAQVPVHVIVGDAALIGTAGYGLRTLSGRHHRQATAG
jgi:glucokinase